ncbi:hypothetical protein A2U01_0048790, partial [Trifolium medium]|nr:hypothetical protein [Trifolium medium]
SSGYMNLSRVDGQFIRLDI